MRLAEFMEKRGMSGRELSKKSGVHYVQIMGYLRIDPKQGKLPSIENLIKIARALRVSLEELTGMEIAKGIEKRLADNPKLTEKAERFAEAYNGLPADDWRRKAISDMLREEFEKRKSESQDKEEPENKDK